ncbi:hypothetical protein [Pantoea agglomerans]
MKKTIFIFFILLLIVIFFNHSKPKVVISNKSLGDVFVFFGTSEKGVEPDYEEIKQSRHALKISQGESVELSISIFDYFLENGQVNIGWRLGGLMGAEIKRVNYTTLSILSGSSRCVLAIDIYKDKDNVSYQRNSFCIKSFEITSDDD